MKRMTRDIIMAIKRAIQMQLTIWTMDIITMTSRSIPVSCRLMLMGMKMDMMMATMKVWSGTLKMIEAPLFSKERFDS